MKKTNFMVGLVGVLAFFAACGKDRIGGDSETNWMKRCDSEADCGSGTECLCGICSRPCAAANDCSALEGETDCASPEGIVACPASAPPAGVCVAACSSSRECPGGFECSASACDRGSRSMRRTWTASTFGSRSVPASAARRSSSSGMLAQRK